MATQPDSSPGAQEELAELFGGQFKTGIIVVSPRKLIVALNPVAGEIIGLPPARTRNQPISILPEPLPEILVDALERKVHGARRVQLKLMAGQQQEVFVSITMLDGGAEFQDLTVMILNCLAPGASDEAIQQLNRLASVGTLSAGMAHEIKNALVAVKTFIELRVEQEKDTPFGTTVLRELRRIDSLVSQMLKYAGPAKPTFSSVHLHQLIEHSLQVLAFQLRDKQIQVCRDFGVAADSVEGDPFQLEQAFTNVLLNGLESMRIGGQLTIRTRLMPPDASPTSVEVQIADTGTGVSPENLKRLFDTFFTTKEKGTGLGLTIARRIFHEHGGTISVASELNKGTVFTMTLPFRQAGTPTRNEPPAA